MKREDETIYDISERIIKELPRVEVDKEIDGRWIADMPSIPGAMEYGSTEDEAVLKSKALALRIIADLIENLKK